MGFFDRDEDKKSASNVKNIEEEDVRLSFDDLINECVIEVSEDEKLLTLLLSNKESDILDCEIISMIYDKGYEYIGMVDDSQSLWKKVN